MLLGCLPPRLCELFSSASGLPLHTFELCPELLKSLVEDESGGIVIDWNAWAHLLCMADERCNNSDLLISVRFCIAQPALR
jgi:hypothetical protein